MLAPTTSSSHPSHREWDDLRAHTRALTQTYTLHTIDDWIHKCILYFFFMCIYVCVPMTCPSPHHFVSLTAFLPCVCQQLCDPVIREQRRLHGHEAGWQHSVCAHAGDEQCLQVLRHPVIQLRPSTLAERLKWYALPFCLFLLRAAGVHSPGRSVVFESVMVEGIHPRQNLGLVQPCNYIERIIAARTW